MDRLNRLVEKYNFNYELINHEISGKTTDEAERALNIPREKILKTLILFSKKNNNFIGVITTGNRKLDFKKLSDITSLKNIKFASSDQIFKLTGFEIGGVPPLALDYCDYKIIDKEVFKKDYVIGAGGTPFKGFKINPSELMKMKPIIDNIIK